MMFFLQQQQDLLSFLLLKLGEYFGKIGGFVVESISKIFPFVKATYSIQILLGFCIVAVLLKIGFSNLKLLIVLVILFVVFALLFHFGVM